MQTMVASYTREMTDFCEVEWRRQKTFDAIDCKASSKKPQTATPVVELRPFKQKEWARETSLPCATDTTPRPAADTSVVPKFTLPKDLVQSSGDFPQVHVINLAEQTFPKTSGLHPPVDARPYWRYQNHHGFTTLGERTKTTLEDIRSGNSVSKSFSCSKQALTPRDVNKMQEIRLCGAKMRKDIGKRRLQYLDPWAKYEHKEFHAAGEHRKPNFYKDISLACFSFESISKADVYDSFDLAGSLPSLHINHPTSKSHRIRQGSRSRSGKRADGWRRTGGIKNSFQIMSEHGPPATIERQLTMELGIKLENLRRNRETPINACTQPLRRFQQVTYRSGPTTGEIQLQRGMTLNSRRSRRDEDEFVDMAENLASHSTTHTKTECRDSGIQSPVDTDDEDSVSVDKEQPKESSEDTPPSQLAEQGTVKETEKRDDRVIDHALTSKNTTKTERVRNTSKSASEPGKPLDDSVAIMTVARENLSPTEHKSDAAKPKLHLPEICPSAVEIL